MKIYKIVMMSGKEIPLKEEQLDALIDASKRGGLIKTSYGIVNCSSIDSIILHTELMRDMNQREKTPDDLLGPSPFDTKKLLN